MARSFVGLGFCASVALRTASRPINVPFSSLSRFLSFYKFSQALLGAPSVSLPFAPRLRFTLIPMDAPPYGRAVSDAPPHSGLSPIAVFRHYSSRHLICIVPFFHAEALRSTGVAPLPRYYGLIRLLLSLSLFAVLPSSLAELSKHAATFAPPRPLTPKSSRCGGVGFTHTETLTTRK